MALPELLQDPAVANCLWLPWLGMPTFCSVDICCWDFMIFMIQLRMAGCFWWELETSCRTDRFAQMSSVCKLFVQQVGLPWRSDPGLQPATVLWHANHRRQLLFLQDVSLGAWGCTQSQVWNKKHDNSRWSKCDGSEDFGFLQIKHPFCNMYVPRKSKVGRWRCRCNGVSKCDAFARQGMKALIWDQGSVDGGRYADGPAANWWGSQWHLMELQDPLKTEVWWPVHWWLILIGLRISN